MARVGAMIKDVPGGSASLPSSVTQINRFCRECGSFCFSLLNLSLSFDDFGWNCFGASEAIALVTSSRRIKHQQLNGIIFQNLKEHETNPITTLLTFVKFYGESINKFP